MLEGVVLLVHPLPFEPAVALGALHGLSPLLLLLLLRGSFSRGCLSGVSRGYVSGVCLRGVSPGCVSGVSLRGVSQGCVCIYIHDANNWRHTALHIDNPWSPLWNANATWLTAAE